MASARRAAVRRPMLPVPRRGEPLGAMWWIAIAVLYLPVRLLVHVRVRRPDRLPSAGPAIVVTNHVSHADPLLVGRVILDLGRLPRFLAKDGIFAVPVVGAAMRAMGHIPVARGSAEARHSFAAALQALEDGGVIVMHPEGTVTRDPEGWPMAGKTGAARLALLAPDVPVVPLAQWGVQQSIDLYRKKVRLLPRPQHELSFGEPVDLSRFRAGPVDARSLAGATETIMRRLRHDVSQLRGIAEPDDELFVWKRSAAR